jgi:hypothetical protein
MTQNIAPGLVESMGLVWSIVTLLVGSLTGSYLTFLYCSQRSKEQRRVLLENFQKLFRVDKEPFKKDEGRSGILRRKHDFQAGLRFTLVVAGIPTKFQYEEITHTLKYSEATPEAKAFLMDALAVAAVAAIPAFLPGMLVVKGLGQHGNERRIPLADFRIVDQTPAVRGQLKYKY